MIPAVYPLILLGVCLVLLAAVVLAPCLQAFRKGWFVIATIAAMLYAGTKPEPQRWSFEFNLGLTNNGSTYDETEHVAMARWTWNQAVAAYKLVWKYRINDGAWVDLPEYDVTDGMAVAYIPAEIGDTVRIQCYTRYVAPEQTSTNGVYHLGGVMRSIDSTNSPSPKYVGPGIQIWADLSDGAELLAPPTNVPPGSAFSTQAPNREGQGNE